VDERFQRRRELRGLLHRHPASSGDQLLGDAVWRRHEDADGVDRLGEQLTPIKREVARNPPEGDLRQDGYPSVARVAALRTTEGNPQSADAFSCLRMGADEETLHERKEARSAVEHSEQGHGTGWRPAIVRSGTGWQRALRVNESTRRFGPIHLGQMLSGRVRCRRLAQPKGGRPGCSQEC
jgi:hypothetical protein